jgi:hypothetical protein
MNESSALLDPLRAERCSVWDYSEKEALEYKWIESERAGRDLGEAALRRWVLQHWWGFLRSRWIEHLEGKRFWVELDRGDFDLLHRQVAGDRLLVDRIVDQLKAGKENLDVILWAEQSGIPIAPVLAILQACHINSQRLEQRFATPDPVEFARHVQESEKRVYAHRLPLLRKEDKAAQSSSTIEFPVEPAEGPSNPGFVCGAFFGGMGSVLELFPSLPAYPGQDDAAALWHDWEAVGADLWSAARESVRPTEAPDG